MGESAKSLENLGSSSITTARADEDIQMAMEITPGFLGR